jgi:uncharacterized protein (DUF4415 family)
MRKKGDIVHYSAEELRGKIARGEDRTDWRKAVDIDEQPDWTQAVVGIPAPKDHINIRVDHDVLEWFKASGKGYQTLMNNVLSAFVKSRQQGGAVALGISRRCGLGIPNSEKASRRDPQQ